MPQKKAAPLAAAGTAAPHMARLAHLARDLEHKRVLCTDLEKRIDTAERVGLVVAGERWMLGELQERLKQALLALEEMAKAQDAAAAQTCLASLEELLADPQWDLAPQVVTDLAERAEKPLQTIRGYQDQIAEWQAQMHRLEEQTSAATQARAPVVRERRELLRLQAMVDQAERAQREQQFSQLIEAMGKLETETDKPGQISTAIEAKVKSTQHFVRQADLLLLQSPLLDNERYEYTVLLRTPSEPGSHGINIQDSSTLSVQDHRVINKAVDDVTDQMNNGLARAFAARSAPAAAPQAGTPAVPEAGNGGAGGVIRDLNPPAAPGAGREGEGGVQNVNEMAHNVGDLMYRLFMPEPMQRYISETPCSLTITTNDLEVPWELMWCEDTENKFLCLDRPVARLPMGRAFPRRESEQNRGGTKLRFLLIHADPTGNLPAAGLEIARIQEGLARDWKDQIDIKVLTPDLARGADLNEILRGGAFDVIHYAGHAVFNEQNPDLSGLWLAGKEVFYAQKIRRLLEGRPFVFLNACESGRTANEESPQAVDRFLQRPAEGLASSFIYGGALGCIGALWPVYDDAAADFAIEFYNRVLDGHLIGEAMRQARLAIRNRYPSQITWAAFVLYGDPTFRLVE